MASIPCDLQSSPSGVKPAGESGPQSAKAQQNRRLKLQHLGTIGYLIQQKYLNLKLTFTDNEGKMNAEAAKPRIDRIEAVTADPLFMKGYRLMTKIREGRPGQRSGSVSNMGTLLLVIGVAATLSTILFPEFVDPQADNKTGATSSSPADR